MDDVDDIVRDIFNCVSIGFLCSLFLCTLLLRFFLRMYPVYDLLNK